MIPAFEMLTIDSVMLLPCSQLEEKTGHWHSWVGIEVSWHVLELCINLFSHILSLGH